MTRTITNPKPLQAKSRTHTVTQTGAQTYEVKSGNSGSIYYVTSRTTGGMTCNCKWGQYRKSADPRAGCSHVQSVYSFINSKNAYAWKTQEQAQRQHRPTLNIGDGIILTIG